MTNCPHYDYGKSADKALGAYCTKKKKCVEKEDCEGCKPRRVCDCGYELYHKVFDDKYLMCSKCHKLYDAKTGKPFGCEEGEEE